MDRMLVDISVDVVEGLHSRGLRFMISLFSAPEATGCSSLIECDFSRRVYENGLIVGRLQPF